MGSSGAGLVRLRSFIKAPLTRCLQYEHHSAGQPVPGVFLRGQLLAALCRELVELRLTSIVRLAPVRFNPASLLHSVERWVKRSLLHLQYFLRDLPNALRDAITMYGSERNDL